MCGNMVDIQTVTAEIRRGKKEEDRRNLRAKIKWPALLHRVAIIRSKLVKKILPHNILTKS